MVIHASFGVGPLVAYEFALLFTQTFLGLVHTISSSAGKAIQCVASCLILQPC
jgi:hypothetical protein